MNRQPLHGPSKVGDVNIAYRSFEPDPDRIRSGSFEIVHLEGARLEFREPDGVTGAKYAATGLPVPNIQCIVEVSAFNAMTLKQLVVEIVGNGIGRSGDPYPPLGMVDIRFKLVGKDDVTEYSPRLTQAKLGSAFPSFQWDQSPKQHDLSLLYRQFPLPDVLGIFRTLFAKRLIVKLVFGFDKKLVEYDAALAEDTNITNVVKKFNECVARTNLYAGHLHVPTD
jgi:hypothetical protein